MVSQRLLGWPEAAGALGWVPEEAPEPAREAAGRRLRDAVMARERQTGKRIATRLGGRQHPKTKITLGALARHLPELRRSRADQLAENFKQYLGEIDERIADCAASEVQRLVQPQIRELHGKADDALNRAEDALERIDTLAARVALLAGGSKARP